MLKQSSKQAGRRKKFKKIGEVLSHYVIDPHIGITTPHPWRIRKSVGYDVMQIISDPGMSKLERRTLLQSQDDSE